MKGANICISECSTIMKDLANKKEKGVCEQKRSDCKRFVLLKSKWEWPMQCCQTGKTDWSGMHHISKKEPGYNCLIMPYYALLAQ